MKKIFLSSAALLPFLLIGCKGMYCPGFPDNLTIFMPYTTINSDVKFFVDERGDTVNMILRDRYIQGPINYEWDCKCACDYPFYVVKLSYGACSEKTIDTLINIEAKVSHFRETATEDELEFNMEICHSSHYSSHFNCQKNNDTVLFTLASDSSYFDSLVVVKGIGLASFNTSDGHKYTLVSEN